MNEALLVFLAFVTLWVLIIAGFLYLRARPSRRLIRKTGPSALAGSCCLEITCSAKCAAEQQVMRDRLAVQYDKVMHELVSAVQAGNELEGPDRHRELA